MVHNICLLSSGLAIVLLVFTIDTPLGWFTLVIWVCVFAVEGLLAWKTYKQLYQLLYQEVVEFKNMVNTLVNGNPIPQETEMNVNPPTANQAAPEHAVNPSTANQAALEHLAVIHGALWFFTTLLHKFLTMKYEMKKQWPFEADDANIRAFVVAIVSYILTLIGTIILKPQFPKCAGMVHKICLLIFGFAIVVLLSTIDIPLGWFTLVFWVCAFAAVGRSAWKTYKQLYQEVVEFKNKVNTPVNGNPIPQETEMNGNTIAQDTEPPV
ncbi:hypothetical protein F0562_016013 [Nyssa sinensis]|uniref:Transmembrane protein n=1 Tax=Nyssa sinensis TaxID=561372 RepID=A0A5J4ZKK6_9ASTE|nr:hypothetical protein F0562_016013 [Nyssa sinensis]